jgi:hypothetical protein
VTSLVWRQDPHLLLAGSKDGLLSQFSFKDAKRPADKLNPIGLDIGCSGDLAQACSQRIIDGFGKHGGASKLANMFGARINQAEEFRLNASSKLTVYPHEALKVRLKMYCSRCSKSLK